EIIADAGAKGAVTVATNMAGRGVDIKINDEVKALGGLYIIGTERHESRRIDNQLRGRAGRQGDPGESRFFLSLEDNLLRIFGSDKIKNIMERLGIKEGESIESRMVTRAVENAQKKVENLHFESRKYVLEYDDVANEQRKTIYVYRNELLDPNYDLNEKINSNRVEYVDYLFENAEIFDGMDKDDINYEPLIAALRNEIGENFTIEELKEFSNVNQTKDYIVKRLKDAYDERMKVIDDEQKNAIEKQIYLQIVDRDWREHLYQMDILKTGIGLRGYNQKDPLTEYKKESYNLFLELVLRLKTDSIRALQGIRFKTKEEIEAEERARELAQQRAMAELERAMKTNKEAQNTNEQQSLPNTPIRVPKKPRRNEPCPCGSGKKYKDCCGKSGPKKGEFAK
ncbi:SEC-C metal-binding domain-containing protein, partial [Campylobacter ureolyticus]